MPTDRSLLLESMALQGAVSLTFGLAFLGLWWGFHRPAAARWAAAWLVYAVGITFAVLGVRFGLGLTSGPTGNAVLAFLLLVGIVLFRAGTDALVDPATVKARRYVTAAFLMLASLLALRGIETLGLLHVHPSVGPFLLPRTLMGLAYAWAAWPLRTVARQRWVEGYALMTGALLCLSLRMFGSVGYEIWQIRHGAAGRPESLLLTIMQVCFLIAFGVATALVLVEVERLEAVRAARIIQETADALRASEARFRFVVEHTSDIQVIAGGDGRIRYVAPSCERLLGVPPSAFEGRALVELAHPEDRETVTAAWVRLRTDPQARRPPTSVRLQHQSGEWVWFDVSGQLVPQASGEDAMIFSVRDVTAQRQLETVLRQRRRMDSLGRMAGNIAHDFNNTLTAILGGLELVTEKTPADSPSRRHLDIMQAAARRGEALTRQLLTFARQSPMTSERFDVRDRLKALEGVVGMAVGRGIRVSVPQSDESLTVKGDADQFDQVIMNLAINARDAMPSGGQLTIQSQAVAASEVRLPVEATTAGRWVRVVVEDSGTGIPAAIVDRIFEPFFTTKEEGRGTGLGLASAYGFARQSGGTLSVETTEGVGSRFLLDLPVDERAAA